MQRRNFMAGIGLLTVFGPQIAQAVVNDPLPAEGVTFTYRVLFGDSEIGTRKITIRKHDKAEHVVIEHETKLEVRVLFAVAYALDHRSTEVWQGLNLKSVRSTTVENDKKTVIEGDTTEEGFQIRDGQSKSMTPGPAVTSDSFWLAAAMEAANVVNMRTGDAAAPKVKKLGNGRWHLKADFSHGPVEATVRFDGDFLAEAEIDSDGHVVKMQRVTT